MTRWTVRLLIAVGLSLLLLGALEVAAQEPDPRRAGLIVVHEDGRIITRCVSLAADEISGAELLEQSGISLTFQAASLGRAVCALDGVGCPPTDCFCQCKSRPCRYWTYFYRTAEQPWIYSPLGSTARRIHPGDVDAWIWSDGGVTPPDLQFTDLCPETLAAATPTLPPTLSAPPQEPSAPSGSDNGSFWSFIPAPLRPWLQRYGGFILIVGALIALAWLQRNRRRDQHGRPAR